MGVCALPKYREIVEDRAVKNEWDATEIGDVILVVGVERIAEIVAVEKDAPLGRSFIAAKELSQSQPFACIPGLESR